MALSDLKKNSARSPKRALSVDEFIAGAEHYAMGLPEPIHRLDGVGESASVITGTADTFAAKPDAAKAISPVQPQPTTNAAISVSGHNAVHHEPDMAVVPDMSASASTAEPITASVSQHVSTVKLTHRLAPPSAKSLRAVSMKPEPMKHATFTLTAECIALLQELSQLHGTSKSALVRQLIQLASAEQAQTASSHNYVSPWAAPPLNPTTALPTTALPTTELPTTLRSSTELPASVVKPLATNATYRKQGDRNSDSTDENQ